MLARVAKKLQGLVNGRILATAAAIALLGALSTSCGNVRLPVLKEKQTINGKEIKSGMSDAEILKLFGIEIASAKSETHRGPDGSTVSYRSGEQRVSITRSVVSGTNVMAFGPIAGEWKLDD
jgi:hypothetical protein